MVYLGQPVAWKYDGGIFPIENRKWHSEITKWLYNGIDADRLTAQLPKFKVGDKVKCIKPRSDGVYEITKVSLNTIEQRWHVWGSPIGSFDTESEITLAPADD